MRIDPIDTISQAATDLTDSGGLRTGSSLVVERVCRSLSGQTAFVALGRSDGDVCELIGAHGVGAADFHRLEQRITKSGLWRMLNVSSPFVIDDLAQDVVLNFLAFGAATRSLMAVPITLKGRTEGILAVGFPAGKSPEENSTIKFLKVIAAMIAQAIRVEQTVNDESRRLNEENVHLKKELKEKYEFGRLIGNSNPMRQVYDRASQVARSNATVLLRGESGTGKELIANAIHYNSLRSKRPLIRVNCSALSENLIESELFGYEKGAINGATTRKKGRFEQADGGTLFLDEIGDLPSQTQAKVLRILQEREFERLGGTETIKINVRLISATNKDLEEAIINRTFSDELFDRLNVFTIFLPPLRERKSDILLLADHFLEKYEEEQKKAFAASRRPRSIC